MQGLLGEAPFDGSQFPPLPWGGKRVADEQIQFISDWIDDGLPVQDQSLGQYDFPVASINTEQTSSDFAPLVELRGVTPDFIKKFRG